MYFSNVEYVHTITLPNLATWPGTITTSRAEIPASCVAAGLIINNPGGCWTIVLTPDPCNTIELLINYSNSSRITSQRLSTQLCYGPTADGVGFGQAWNYFAQNNRRNRPPQYQCIYNRAAVGAPVSCPVDPNIKIAYPVGCGPNHLISANTDSILYHIIFRNEGGADAINVVVVDTVPANLNIDSVRVLYTSASKYRWEVTPDRALKVYLDSAFVPPAAVASAGSYGYVSFSAKLAPGLIPGTEIRNRAGIYFDYQPPVITPDIFHTIEDENLELSVVPSYTTLCSDDSVMLTALPAGGEYRWSTGDTTQSIVVGQGGFYTVKAKLPLACDSLIANAYVDINTYGPDKVSISSGLETAICQGDSVLLSVMPADLQGVPPTVLWSNGSTTPSIWVSEPDTYRVAALYPNTCDTLYAETVVLMAETLHSGVARKTYHPSTWYDVSFSLPKSVYFQVPAELPVSLGNAGNHRAWLYITDSVGNRDTITYRGGGSQAHPVGSIEIAKGLKYPFTKGTNGLASGSTFDAVAVRLTINGCWRHGETNVPLRLLGSCSPLLTGKSESADGAGSHDHDKGARAGANSNSPVRGGMDRWEWRFARTIICLYAGAVFELLKTDVSVFTQVIGERLGVYAVFV